MIKIGRIELEYNDAQTTSFHPFELEHSANKTSLYEHLLVDAFLPCHYFGNKFLMLLGFYETELL